MAIGCDVAVGGIKSLGAATMYKKIIDLRGKQIPVYGELLDLVVKKSKKDKVVIETYVQSFMCEPANDVSECNEDMKYLYTPPTSLPKYLEAFASLETTVVPGPELLQCVGPTKESTHIFMKAEEHYRCHLCKATVCKTCVIENIISDNKVYLCMQCYKDVALTGYVSDDDGGGNVSLMEMKNKLSLEGIDLPAAVFPNEIEEIFESLVCKRQCSEHGNMADEVIFPIRQSNTLSDNSRLLGEELITVSLCDGGIFLSDRKSISNENLPGVLALMAKFVSFTKNHRHTAYDHPIYNAVPTMMIDFAFGSRSDSGYRLVQRCARHAMDSKSRDISNKKATLFHSIDDGDNIVIILENTVPASMKDKEYNVKVAITKDKLIACTCNCAASGFQNERVVCVHVLPVLLQFSFLLIDGLAEHMLLELSSRWNEELENEMKEKHLLGAILKHIIQIMITAGYNAIDTKQHQTITKYLASFSVGTEKKKMCTHIISPNPEMLCPLCQIPKKSVAYASAEKLGRVRPNANNYNNTVRVISQQHKPKQNASSKPVPIKRNSLSCFDPVSCDCCTGSITTKQICIQSDPLGSRILMEDGKEVRICGIATCIACWDGINGEYDEEECRVRCKKHIQINKGTYDMNDNVTKNVNESQLSTFKPDYSMISLAIEALSIQGSDDANDFIGRRLVEERNECSMVSDGMKNAIKKEFKKQWDNVGAQTYYVVNVGNNKLFKKSKALESTECQPCKNLLDELINDSDTTEKPMKRKGGADKYKCCFVGCTNGSSNKTVRFKRVPPPVTKTISGSSKMSAYYSHYRKKTYRSVMLDRCGLSKSDDRKQLRLCSAHKCEDYDFVTYFERNNIKHKMKISMQIPKSTGVVRVPFTRSKGLDRYRRARQYLENSQSSGSNEGWSMLAQTALSQKEMTDINDSVYSLLDPYNLSPREEVNKHSCSVDVMTDIKRKRRDKPVVSFAMDNGEVYRRTGFIDKKAMLAFIVIVHNGNVDKISKSKISTLTWFEEWVLYFEVLHGQTLTQWGDTAVVFNIREDVARKIFDSCLLLVLCCQESWPIYVSRAEDKVLRKEKWSKRYKNHRVVMWDDTNISFDHKPGDAQIQRLTYSAYYGENCAKGGVALQLCGWIRVMNLWVGATSDTHYQENTGIFKEQDDFSQSDIVEGHHIPFTNIFDKGYRSRLAAWRSGRQLTIQPNYAKSDQKFKAKETIQSASVATDRSANERAVKLSKRSGFLKHGLKNNGNPVRLDDAWLAWSFQINFMFAPVL